jgi:DNA invertase Pin-like site-specific DNA recombinase
VSKLTIGYARVSTDAQDLTAQRDAMEALGVDPERIYVDHGLTGTHRDRPGLRRRWRRAAPVTRWWSRSSIGWRRRWPDARAIADELAAREVKLALSTSVHDPTDPVGRLLFNVLAMVAAFEADLIRARTREEYEGGKGQGPAARQAAHAEPDAGGASGQAVPRRGAHRSASSRSSSASPARRCTARCGAPGRAPLDPRTLP